MPRLYRESLSVFRNPSVIRADAFSELFKSILTQSANGTDPILADILPFGSGSDSVFRIADFGNVFVSAGTNVFYHNCLLCRKIRRSKLSLFTEISSEQALEASAVPGFVLSHFVNGVMDSVEVQCFGTGSDTLLVFACT